MNGGAGQLATVISPTLLNELRFGLNRRAETRDTYVPGQPNGSQINITGVSSFGVDYQSTGFQIIAAGRPAVTPLN